MGTTATTDTTYSLACPACRKASLEELNGRLRCSDCRRRFPIFNCAGESVPWLYEDGEAALAQWRARYRGFLERNRSERARIESALAASPSGPVRRRLQALANARSRQRRSFEVLLAPFELAAEAAAAVVPSQVSKRQGLLSYHDNVFRDWSWNTSEAEALWEALASVVPSGAQLGTVLTLGAGPGRLAYDLHRFGGADCSVLLDINPLLMAVAAKVISGGTVELPEFPLAPIDAQAFDRNCAVPEAAAGPFHFVLGDASRPPFAAQSFDTILTPWLIDILEEDPREFFARVNGLLRDGGLWLNTGTLFFESRNPACRYSEAEVFAIVEESGFQIELTDRRELDYLSSPDSGHGRRERVTSFSARKVESATAPASTGLLPAWIADTALPVPKPGALVLAASERLLQAQVLAAVDGERSVAAIAALVAQQYDLPLGDAAEAVRQILMDADERSGTGS